jgi:hypothetical protein
MTDAMSLRELTKRRHDRAGAMIGAASTWVLRRWSSRAGPVLAYIAIIGDSNRQMP